jgi:DNA-binding TFAR19-related protein (PDSD5 family)
MPGGVSIQVKKTGRIRPPKLDNSKLTAIGVRMVENQKYRWSLGVNASGAKAKKLSVKYFFEKRGYQKGGTPIRDNVMTGLMKQNFTLRRATEGVIRAENTSREARAHAQRSQGYEEMIGFAPNEQLAVIRLARSEYGNYVEKAWIPIG